MVKPYTWEEIREVLSKELKKTKHIMTFGTIGSCNVERDIDVIISKKPKSKTSDFYKEIHNLFDSINQYMTKNYGVKVIRFSGYEPEFLTLSQYKKNDLAIQTLVYVSYTQIEKDWTWALFSNEKVRDILKDYKCLKGNVKDLFSEEFLKGNDYDPIFIYLTMYDRINSNYSEEFLVKVMNHYFEFLYEKRLGLKTPIAKNEKDVRKYFYELCDKVDNMKKKEKGIVKRLIR